MSRIAKLVLAARDPDEYRREHGRCPGGWNFDEQKDRCIELSPEEPRDREQEQEERDEREAMKKRSTGPTRKKRVDRKAAERELADLYEKDFHKYLERVDDLRDAGVLPSKEASEKLAEIENWTRLPEKVIRDPERLDDVIKKQAAQRAHEERVAEEKVKYVENFFRQRKLAVERGEKPPRLSLEKMMIDMANQMGRPISDEKKRRAKEKLFKAPKGTDPGSWLQKFKEVMESFVSPRWRHRIQGTTAGLSDVLPLDEPRWTLGFPPYDTERTPRRHLPETRNRGFPPFDDGEREGALRPEFEIGPTLDFEGRAPLMRGFPPYDKAEDPRATDNVGLPPYDAKPPRTKSYIPGKQPRPGFPPYQDGVYRVR